ncbi:MAG: type III toxin-antitoxin system ToxN/AbiQ family toxin [Clostridia bacterium]|nr:type III toxin-antitoxin system ToxN/AbiQ family toxin [Clostridia bacterium]
MADKLYKFVTVDKKEFFTKICCDYRLLEEKCKCYKSNR